MIPMMTPILDDLRTAAKASPRSQAEIARALGLGPSQVCMFYAGRRGLSVEAAEKLAALLGLEIVARPVDKAKAKPKAKAKKKGK
jgi:transcriptional regulator with XRE-family HTH domain